MLTEKEISEFQGLYKNKLDKEISRVEAIKSANNLANFFALLLKIDRRNNPEKYKQLKDRRGN